MLLPLLMNLDFSAGAVITPPIPPSTDQSGDGFRNSEIGRYYDKEKIENEERIKKQIKDEDELFQIVLQGFLKMMN